MAPTGLYKTPQAIYYGDRIVLHTPRMSQGGVGSRRSPYSRLDDEDYELLESVKDPAVVKILALRNAAKDSGAASKRFYKTARGEIYYGNRVVLYPSPRRSEPFSGKMYRLNGMDYKSLESVKDPQVVEALALRKEVGDPPERTVSEGSSTAVESLNVEVGSDPTHEDKFGCPPSKVARMTDNLDGNVETIQFQSTSSGEVVATTGDKKLEGFINSPVFERISSEEVEENEEAIPTQSGDFPGRDAIKGRYTNYREIRQIVNQRIEEFDKDKNGQTTMYSLQSDVDMFRSILSLPDKTEQADLISTFFTLFVSPLTVYSNKLLCSILPEVDVVNWPLIAETVTNVLRIVESLPNSLQLLSNIVETMHGRLRSKRSCCVTFAETVRTRFEESVGKEPMDYFVPLQESDRSQIQFLYDFVITTDKIGLDISSTIRSRPPQIILAILEKLAQFNNGKLSDAWLTTANQKEFLSTLKEFVKRNRNNSRPKWRCLNGFIRCSKDECKDCCHMEIFMVSWDLSAIIENVDFHGGKHFVEMLTPFKNRIRVDHKKNKDLVLTKIAHGAQERSDERVNALEMKKVKLAQELWEKFQKIMADSGTLVMEVDQKAEIIETD